MVTGKCFIVAEIGVNHCGVFTVADNMVKEAAECGVDAVKFQLWEPDTFPELSHLRLTAAAIHELSHTAARNGVDWFCSPFDVESISHLEEIGMRIWKIPGNKRVWDDTEYWERLSSVRFKDWLIVSAPDGVDRRSAEEWISGVANVKRTTYLYCVHKYPATEMDLAFPKYLFGFSDHTHSIYAPVEAVRRGAIYIEKHFTLDHTLSGPDHSSSLEPPEMKRMVELIREVIW